MPDLSEMRQEFTTSDLTKKDLEADPFFQFEKWFRQAEEGNISMPNSMSLATVSESGQPSLRTVLLKYFDQEGFVFYTNYESRKAQEIKQNPKVALLFFWKEFERQIKITGSITKVSATESMKYFLSRPKGSQIGAWVSNQSDVISSRQILLSKFEELKRKFQNKEVPLPSFWGGYQVVPDSFEFWQGRVHRLHDRFVYSKEKNRLWKIERLAP
ncbi:pyridoxamine 5'-phosphate oxidase [Saprospiraceae bacterium]|nr:pyridoxamine 5'-phosphate oxidase [Saprospiraceae bacterium]